VPSFVYDFIYDSGEETWSGKRHSDRDPLPGTRNFTGDCPGNRCCELLTATGTASGLSLTDCVA